MKFLLPILFFLLSISVKAADSTIINFLPRALITQEIAVYINKTFVGKIGSLEHLKCKIEHQDSILVTYSAWDKDYELYIELYPGDEKYYIMPKSSFLFDEESKVEWDFLAPKIKKKVFFNKSIESIFSNNNTKPIIKPIEKTELHFYSDLRGVASILINGNFIETIAPNERLKCKLYSQGRLTIHVVIGNVKLTTLVDLKKNKANYVIIKNGASVVSERDWGEITEDIEKTIIYNEKKSNPIGELPDDIFTAKQGTGFLINNQGYLVTNAHVVTGANSITIRGINGDYQTKLGAELIAIDLFNDLALLKITSSLVKFENPPYSIANSKKIKQGESVFTLGYPRESIMGQEIKVTDGIISSKSGLKSSISHFQFSAPIQPGNSGGPLLNKNGDVVGIATAVLNRDLAESVAYAIKSDYLKFFLNQVENFEYSNTTNTINTTDLPQLVSKISDFVFIIETE